MDQISIRELTVFFHIGVTAQERANQQRLTLTVEMDRDFSNIGDDVAQTIDYQAVSQRLLDFGRGRSWKLIETLATELAETILRDYKPSRVTVEVRKFIIPQARDVCARVTRLRDAGVEGG